VKKSRHCHPTYSGVPVCACVEIFWERAAGRRSTRRSRACSVWESSTCTVPALAADTSPPSTTRAQRLQPNSATLAGSKLVRSWPLTSFEPVCDQLRTSFEPDSVMEFGFNRQLISVFVIVRLSFTSHAMYINTHRRSIAQCGGCFQRRLFVCCQHDNFRTLKRRMMKLAVTCNVQTSRPSSNVKVKDQGHRDKKNEKVRHFVRESSSGARSSCGIFFRRLSSWALLCRWENQRMLSSFRAILSSHGAEETNATSPSVVIFHSWPL